MNTATLRIAVAQLNCTVGDLAGNAAKIAAAAAEAKGRGAHVLLTPELALKIVHLRPDWETAR